jgi:hypothetical protein
MFIDVSVIFRTLRTEISANPRQRLPFAIQDPALYPLNHPQSAKRLNSGPTHQLPVASPAQPPFGNPRSELWIFPVFVPQFAPVIILDFGQLSRYVVSFSAFNSAL